MQRVQVRSLVGKLMIATGEAIPLRGLVGVIFIRHSMVEEAGEGWELKK